MTTRETPKDSRPWSDRIADLETQALRIQEDLADLLSGIDTIATILGIRIDAVSKRSNSSKDDGNVENDPNTGFSASFTPVFDVDNPVDNP